MTCDELTVDGLLDYYGLPIDSLCIPCRYSWAHADRQRRTYSVLTVNSLHTLYERPVDPLWTLWILACVDLMRA